MSYLRCLPVPVMLALAGCAGLLRSTAPALQLYVLTSPPTAIVSGDGDPKASAPVVPRSSGPTLRVARPLSGPALNSDRIALLRPGNRLDYYAGSRWSAPLADLVSDLELTVLRADPAWSAVADDRSAFNADYLLQTSIDRFTAQYAAEGGSAENRGRAARPSDPPQRRRAGRQFCGQSERGREGEPHGQRHCGIFGSRGSGGHRGGGPGR